MTRRGRPSRELVAALVVGMLLALAVGIFVIVPMFTMKSIGPGSGAVGMNALWLEQELTLALIEVNPSDDGPDGAALARFGKAVRQACSGIAFEPPAAVDDEGALLLPDASMPSGNPRRWRLVVCWRADDLDEPTSVRLAARVAMPDGIAGRPDLYTQDNFQRVWNIHRAAVETAMLAGTAKLPESMRLVIPDAGSGD